MCQIMSLLLLVLIYDLIQQFIHIQILKLKSWILYSNQLLHSLFGSLGHNSTSFFLSLASIILQLNLDPLPARPRPLRSLLLHLLPLSHTLHFLSVLLPAMARQPAVKSWAHRGAGLVVEGPTGLSFLQYFLNLSLEILELLFIIAGQLVAQVPLGLLKLECQFNIIMIHDIQLGHFLSIDQLRLVINVARSGVAWGCGQVIRLTHITLIYPYNSSLPLATHPYHRVPRPIDSNPPSSPIIHTHWTRLMLWAASGGGGSINGLGTFNLTLIRISANRKKDNQNEPKIFKSKIETKKQRKKARSKNKYSFFSPVPLNSYLKFELYFALLLVDW